MKHLPQKPYRYSLDPFVQGLRRNEEWEQYISKEPIIKNEYVISMEHLKIRETALTTTFLGQCEK